MKNYDANLVVIGAGAAGLVSSYIAANTKAKAILIENHKMGGDCLNTGCVPSKAILRSAKMAHYIKRADEFGIQVEQSSVDWPAVRARIHNVIEKIEPHDSVERYEGLGVECINGFGTIISPHEVEVNGRIITTRSIVVATGASPFVPNIPGLTDANYLTSETIWDMEKLPKHLAVLGGGPIGCELTQAFARLGVKVTQIEMLDRILFKEDPEVSAYIQQSLESDDVTVLTECQLLSVNENHQLQCKHKGENISIDCDAVLVAVGRAPNISNIGLENVGVELTNKKNVKVNEYLQTNVKNIFACGDVVSNFQLTHTASHEAGYVALNSLFGFIKKFKVDYSVIPWCTYTDPEVAHVGLNELEAKASNTAYELTHYGIDDLDRAIADGEDKGFIKVLTKPGKDKILGVTIVGPHAGELLAEFVLAMKHNIGLRGILGTVHAYPTLMEANRFASGEWSKAHVPQWLYGIGEAIHKWRRKH